MRIPPKIDENIIKNIDFGNSVVNSAIVAAGALVKELEERVPQEATEVESSGTEFGANFLIPLAAPEGVKSGDERMFEEGALTARDLPLPLRWQIFSDDGHKGSVVVGRIDSIERLENGLGNARGVFDVGVYGRECERLVRGGFLRGVSVDVDKFSAAHAKKDEDEEFADKDEIKNEDINIKSARIMGITIVALPAFQEATIKIEEPASLSDGDEIVEDGIYEEELEDLETEYSTILASAAPVVPPREWFTNPKLNKLTPITTEDDGRVFGHIASWKGTHIGMAGATRPPRSSSKYAYFRTGVLRTTDGDVEVGQLTLVGGHASTSFGAADAVKHYDDTASAIVDVVAGEDEFGIWVAGSLRPDVTPAQIRAFRASAPSGDWRPINGKLELVAVCAVNTPGFMVPRAIVATAGSRITALVAAGASEIAQLKEDQKYRELEERIAKIEFAKLEERRVELISRFADLEEEENSKLQALAASALSRFEAEENAQKMEMEMKIKALQDRFND